jgi:cytochrome c-type biogenesis protein CcsB
MKKMKKTKTAKPGLHLGLVLLAAALVGLASLSVSGARAADSDARLPVEETRGWAVLADGRIKPLQTFADETALVLTGRKGLSGLSSLEIFWGYALSPEEFRERDFIRVDSLDLKERLGLDGDQRRFSFSTLMASREFQALVDQAMQRNRADEELSRLEDDVLGVYTQLTRVADLMAGDAIAIVPLPQEDGAWRAPSQLEDVEEPAAQAVVEGFANLRAAYSQGDVEAFRKASAELGASLRQLNPSLYPPQSSLDRELFYRDLNPFGKAWKLYLAAFLLLLMLGFSESRKVYFGGLALLLAGFALHSMGIGLRWAIAGRAPVSDMYESLVFMGWGVVAFGLVQEAAYRRRFFSLTASLMGCLCLAFAENLPIDSGISPLVPVLAHTSWLAVHVMTIMLAYSALALAMALAHVALVILLYRPHNKSQIRSITLLLYNTLQVGLLFLAAGIICGAVWANESWGRYWGWDPKETWSLITFFVYLAIIHARFAGWLREFGLAAAAILGFLSVIMTYYGVNFILASGLHSYGFAEGGQIYAYLFALLELGVVAAAYARYRLVGRAPAATPEVG